MSNKNEAPAVNPLIIEYLSQYDDDIRDLCRIAIELANNQGIPAVAEQMSAHVKRRTREGRSANDNPKDHS